MLYFYNKDIYFCCNCRWYPSQAGLDVLMGSIKSQYREPWPTWKKIPEEIRDKWFREFRVYIQLHVFITNISVFVVIVGGILHLHVCVVTIFEFCY